MLRANIGCGSIRPEGWDNFDRWYAPDDAENIGHWDVTRPLIRNSKLQYFDMYGLWTGPSPVGDWGMIDGRYQPVPVVDHYDYAVCSFMLQELNHHEIPGALENMMAILKPGGVLRVLVPNITRAFRFFASGQEDWFPQDDRTGGLDAKFCTYVTWFGESRSVFTPHYLLSLLKPHGEVAWMSYGMTCSDHPEIVSLDSRPKEALIMEVTKP